MKVMATVMFKNLRNVIYFQRIHALQGLLREMKFLQNSTSIKGSLIFEDFAKILRLILTVDNDAELDEKRIFSLHYIHIHLNLTFVSNNLDKTFFVYVFFVIMASLQRISDSELLSHIF